MIDSILTSTKKILGLDESYEAFDEDILMHINSVFGTVNQLGIGPVLGFAIEDATATWSELLGDNPLLNPIKTYVYLRVRLLHDPPSTSYLIDALNNQIKELEWRLNVQREMTGWVNPDPDLDDEDLVLDGGGP